MFGGGGRPGGGGGVFGGGVRPGGGGGVFGGGGRPGGRNVPDVTDVIERGVSDAFCASARSFSNRNSKVQFDETLLEKGKMFSVIDSDFQVNITLNNLVFKVVSRSPNLDFIIFKSPTTRIYAELSVYVDQQWSASGQSADNNISLQQKHLKNILILGKTLCQLRRSVETQQLTPLETRTSSALSSSWTPAGMTG